VCLCSLKYPACNAHVPCCHMWPARLYNIFPHYLINGTILWRKNYYPLFFSEFNETWIFLGIFFKSRKYQISWKSVQWEPSCSIRTVRHDEAKSRFSQFYERAQNPRHSAGIQLALSPLGHYICYIPLTVRTAPFTCITEAQPMYVLITGGASNEVICFS